MGYAQKDRQSQIQKLSLRKNQKDERERQCLSACLRVREFAIAEKTHQRNETKQGSRVQSPVFLESDEISKDAQLQGNIRKVNVQTTYISGVFTYSTTTFSLLIFKPLYLL